VTKTIPFKTKYRLFAGAKAPLKRIIVFSFVKTLIYVTVRLWNQGFHEIPENFRDFVKSLIHSGISWNPWNFQGFHEIPEKWCQGFHEIPEMPKGEIKDITYEFFFYLLMHLNEKWCHEIPEIPKRRNMIFFYLLMHLNEKRFQGFHEIPKITKEAIQDIIYEFFYLLMHLNNQSKPEHN